MHLSVSLLLCMCLVNAHPSGPHSLHAQDSTSALDITPWMGRTVMMISAHADDSEFMAGGLVEALRRQATHVVYVIVTNGDKGCTDSKYYNCSIMSSPEIAQVRQAEAIAAAAVLGVYDVVLLDLEDAMVTRYGSFSLLGSSSALYPSCTAAWPTCPHST